MSCGDGPISVFHANVNLADAASHSCIRDLLLFSVYIDIRWYNTILHECCVCHV